MGISLLCLLTSLAAQDYTQNIRGTILDKDAQIPLIGATVSITTVEPLLGTTTDLDGNFRIENVPIGRHNILIEYLGYEPIFVNNILLKTGKELVLTLEMLESAEQLEEVVVSAAAQFDKTKPLNEMATVSARSFSVEETGRYAAAFFDPARMAQNYAGVSIGGAGDDLFNEVIVRGNSPAGVLWRLEGIQIPNPNHFGGVGGSGGAISMLSSSTLANSDFYTGAFPTEFGNSLSSVFDLKLRNGNNEKREYAFMFGALGIEAAMEGPFSPKSKASYLLNYRYSTLGALQAIGLSPTGDVLPVYQDISFKINVPTKVGVFGLFGLGGNNIASFTPVPDSTKWEDPEDDSEGFEEDNLMGVVGASHKVILDKKSWLRTVAIVAREEAFATEYELDPFQDYKEIPDDENKAVSNQFRISSTYSRKINARNTIQIGGIASQMDYNFYFEEYNDELQRLERLFDNKGDSYLLQGFGHLKHRFNEDVTLNAGLHYTQLTLNDAFAIEPRAAVSYQVSPKHRLSIAAGLHSKHEHLGFYLFEGTLPDGTEIASRAGLGLTKSFHGVLGYDLVFNPKLRLKAEAYYQYLYDVPVEKNSETGESIINASDIWDVISFKEATNNGTGQNIGIDLTLEKFFSDNYYFLVTGSLYDSKYTDDLGKTYNTRFNANYQLNTLGGIEIPVGKNKKNILGFNGKAVASGGNRFTPVDFVASKAAGEDIRFTDRRFEDRNSMYWRLDIGVSYKINRKRLTHSIMLDIQNVTNRENAWAEFYNPNSGQIEKITNTGLFPNFNYRVEF